MADGSVPYKMREPCRSCGNEYGSITESGAQDVVRCLDCKRFCYNAPRVETGKAVRTVQSIHEALKPKTRARVFERANGRCELCGGGPPESVLHAGHIISVAQGLANGMTELELNEDDNLIALCDRCNLGMGRSTIPLKLALKIFAVRASRKDQQ